MKMVQLLIWRDAGFNWFCSQTRGPSVRVRATSQPWGGSRAPQLNVSSVQNTLKPPKSDQTHPGSPSSPWLALLQSIFQRNQSALGPGRVSPGSSPHQAVTASSGSTDHYRHRAPSPQHHRLPVIGRQRSLLLSLGAKPKRG